MQKPTQNISDHNQYDALLFKLPAILWAVFILGVSLFPSQEIPKVHIPFADKAVHLFMYAVFSFFILLGFFYKNRTVKSYFLTVFVSSLYGWQIEILQKLCTSFRTFEWADVFFNFTGAVIGGLIFHYLSKRYFAQKL